MAGAQARDLDRVLMSLNRYTESLTDMSVMVELQFLDRIPNYDNSKMPFFNTHHPGDPLHDIFSVNEHMAVLLSIVMNTLVILVFVRVLGITRLASRLVVNMAAINLFSSLCNHYQHETSVTPVLSDSPAKCRFSALLDQECYNLFYYGLCSAMIERIVACSMLSYYNRAQHLLGPCFIVGPWAISIISFLITNFADLQLDLGYQCRSQRNLFFPDPAMSTAKRCSSSMAAFCFVGLLVTTIMHNQSSGDVWEISRTQFELRTTKVVLKMVVTVMLFNGADAVAQSYMANGLTYQEVRMITVAWQISIHKGLALIIVLLTRLEFRRHLFLVFESAESIRRARTTNLLIAHAPTRQLSIRRSNIESEHADDTPRVQSSQGNVAIGARRHTVINSSIALDRALVSRDKLSAVQTPDWLRKKEPETSMGFFKFWGKPKAPSSSLSSYNSDV